MASPFVLSIFYFSFARVSLSDEDYNTFNKRNSFLSGNWYLLSNDSTEVVVLNISPVKSSQEEQYSSNLRVNLEYTMLSTQGGKISQGVLDTIMDYTTTLELPLIINDFVVNNAQEDVLELALKMPDGTIWKTKATKDLTQYSKVVASKTKAQYFLEMTGWFAGDFGQNQLMLKIDKINPNNLTVTGISNVLGNIRPLRGALEFFENSCFFILKEPGDDEYDGVFEFKIFNINPNQIEGTWRSNNGESEREYVLYKQ
jgi:hypothetical protein